MTGNDVITEALTLLGVIYPGQTISSSAQTTGQTSLNNMLGEWSAQQLAVFSISKGTFPLTPGAGAYSIGTGATWNTTRPEKIESWAAITGAGAVGSGKPVDAATFVAIAKDRTATGSVIQALLYDAEYPTGNIYVYPLPNGNVTSVELWMWVQFTVISDFTQTINFPPGYLKAISYNLAADLAPKFGRQLDPNVQRIADQCKAGLGATNITEHVQPQTAGQPQIPPVPAT
jgi:hypothetical protein